ncbi:MAG TPA: IS110 family transposase, partial [Candidatus Dormibacteraeota bacterium]|nr:IS110 family transposase [Candidatus Dormibacteraeota bacterium]
MEVLYARCAGVEVHKKTVVVCRISPGPDGQPLQEIRTFTTMTRDLLALSDWLAEGGVTHVAMESTGVYWKPVYNLLEGTFTLLLVNAAHIKQVPGRKSDVLDCAWIADLLRHGLLKGSFVPERGLRELRELTRYRTALVRERAAEQNRVHKTLEGANIKLSAVATDLMGVSARQMLAALCTGRRDLEAIAQLAKGRLREKIPLLEQALEGDFQPHQRFLVTQQLAHIDYLEALIDQVSEEVAQRLEPLAPPPSGPAPTPGNDALDEAAALAAAELEARREALHLRLALDGLQEQEAVEGPLSFAAAVALLVTITGISQRTAEVIVSEIGTDMSRFPSAGHLCSGAGLVPGLNVSAGKRHGNRTRRGSPWLRSALVESAHG